MTSKVLSHFLVVTPYDNLEVVFQFGQLIPQKYVYICVCVCVCVPKGVKP